MRYKVGWYSKKWPNSTFFNFYTFPVLRVDYFACTKKEQEEHGFAFNKLVYIIVGWLFWTWRIKIEI